MAQKKIIFVITKGNWGGAQRYVFDLATNLPAEQFVAKVVVGRGKELPEKLSAVGIEVIPLPHMGRNISFFDDIKTFFALIKIFYREKPDIVHLNSPKAGGLGALAARIIGVKKIIYTAHGWTFNEPRPQLAKHLIWFASWLTVLLTHFTITITKSEEIQGLRMPWCKNKIKLIHNGLAKPNFLSREIARAKISKLTASSYKLEPVLIGTIAELHRNKGLEYLIRALNLIRGQNWQVVIIGNGEEKDYLEQLITTLELSNEIKLTGFINNAAELLPAFDIFVLPSVKEGLPYVILEAGLAQLPVIATEVGGIPEVVSGGRTGLLIPPRAPKFLAQAIVALLDSPARRQELGKNLERQVIDNFSLEKMVEKFVNLLNT